MAREKSFKFIDTSKPKSGSLARYEIRAQAACYGHSYAKRKHGAGTTLESNQARFPLRPGTACQHQRRDLARRSAQRKAKQADAHLTPLESRLLVPYSRPSFFKDQDWIEDKLHLYFSVILPGSWRAMGMEHLVGVTTEPILNWLRLSAMSDPLIYCTQALLAFVTSSPIDQASWTWYNYMRGIAISEINSALSDPKRMLGCLTIFGVLQMTTYESMQANSYVARDVHVPGLRRMLALKGGEAVFQAEIPNFIMSLSKWYGQCLSEISGTDPVFSPLGKDTSNILGHVRGMVAGGLGSRVMEEEPDPDTWGQQLPTPPVDSTKTSSESPLHPATNPRIAIPQPSIPSQTGSCDRRE